MTLFTRSIAFCMTVLAILILQSTNAQNVLDPNDPVVNYNSSNKPAPPGWMQIGKWVRTPNSAVRTRNTSWYDGGGVLRYKCYIFQNIAFRLMYPKSYNPTANDGKKYPLIIFFHGKGENAKAPLYDASTGLNYDNEFQMIQGPREFDLANQNGTYDGYVLVPQITDAFYQGILDNLLLITKYMIANNKVDPFRIVANGLSEGGIACWEMVYRFPTYTSSSTPMSSPLGGVMGGMINESDYLPKIKFTPIWMSNGGVDVNPSPTQVQQAKDIMAGVGANFKVYTDPAAGHSTWYQMWAQPDFWPFINRSYSSNPWPLRGKNQFWPGEPINATIGIAPGFEAYEWRRNGTLITNAISNQIQVTGIGVYDARVKRDGVWSDWSRVPVPIKGNDYRIEAEDWIAMSGVQAQITSDVDGNLNVTSIDNGNWMDYTVAPYLPGTYTLKLRLAAANSGGKLQILVDNSLIKTIDVPRTSGNQTWQTVTTTLPLSAGQKTIRIKSNATTTFNFNWMEFSMAVESPLPVKFVYFNASCENAGGVALRWRTAMELNTNKFSVERSTDGTHWIEVGSVAAAGQSNEERSYVFSDKTPASDNFYRIVEYDFDGKVTVSSIVRSSCASRTEITLYPNPNSGRSALNMVLQQATNVVIDIMDPKGTIIEQRKLILPAGANSVPIDISNYAKGFYTITVHYNGEIKSLKMIKN